MKKYLVTGGEGFIGSNILKKVLGDSYDLKSELDVLDPVTLRERLKEKKGIFHCAALISVPESFDKKEEYYRNNVLGTKSVAEVAKENSLPIVYSSSAAVYGAALEVCSESSLLKPGSPYAENKRDAEMLLNDIGVPTVVLRYFNVYGPKKNGLNSGVIANFIENALNGEDLVIYGDGLYSRDFVFIDDVAEANVLAMNFLEDNKDTTFEIFNIGTGVSTTIINLAEKIIKLTASTSKIVHKEARQGDVPFSLADISLAKNVLAWEPKVSLDEGIERIIQGVK
jgi:UDP-glucose 4-epimerase